MNKKGEIISAILLGVIIGVSIITVFVVRPRITGFDVYTAGCGGSITTSGYWELDANVDCTSSGNGVNGAVIIDVPNVELDCKGFQIKDAGSFSDFIGIRVNAIKNNIIIRNCNILADSDSGGGYGIQIKGNNTLVKDTNINATDAQFHIWVDSSNLYIILLNTTYTGTVPDESCAGSVVERKWYLDVQVNYSNGTAASGAFVQAFNTSGIADYSGYTDSNGRIRFNATQYINNGGTKTYYNLYKVNATGSYAENSSVDVSSNTFVQLTLAAPVNTAPYNITLLVPANNSVINDTQEVDFSFVAYDNESSTLSCDIYLDDVLNQTNPSVPNATITNFTISGLSYATHNWSVSCNDSELSNVSGVFFFTINDTLAPLINTTPTFGGFYVRPTKQELGAEINFSADIIDTNNVSSIDSVLLNISNSTWSAVYAMSLESGITYVKGFNTSDFGYGNFDFFIWANDSRGNWNETPLQNFSITDLTVPFLWDITITPIFLSAPGASVTISANASDNVAIASVIADITRPDGSKQNYTMAASGGLYDVVLSGADTTQRGRYSVVIWASDGAGNTVRSDSVYYFYVPPVVLITNGETFGFNDNISIIGFGFSASSNITLKINNSASGAVLASFNVSSNGAGNFSLNWTVPANVALGNYTLFALDPLLPAVFDDFVIEGLVASYEAGIAIIPMDLKQGRGDAYNLNYLEAYGLVYKLLGLGMPVDWVITPPCARLKAQDVGTSQQFDEEYCNGFFMLTADWTTINAQNTAGVVLHNLSQAAKIPQEQIVELRRQPRIAILSGSQGQITSTLTRSEINYTLLTETQIISSLTTSNYDIILIGDYDFSTASDPTGLTNKIKDFANSGGYVHAEDRGAISLNSYIDILTSLSEDGKKAGDYRIITPASPLTQTHLSVFSNSVGRTSVLNAVGSYTTLAADGNYDINHNYVKFLGLNYGKGYFTFSGGHLGSEEGSAELSRPRNRLLDNTLFFSLEVNDQNAPNISNVLPVAGSNFFNGTSVNISATVTDDVKVDAVWAHVVWDATQLNLSMSGNAAGSYSTTFTNTASEGRYNITIWANDSEGNIVSATTWFNISIPDTTPPTIQLISPENGYSTNATSITFKYNVSDASAIANCSLVLNGNINATNVSVTKNIEQSFTKTLSVGSYAWKISCYDEAGNQGNSSSRSLTITSAENGTDGETPGMCTNDCSPQGRRVCFGDNAYKTCGNYDSDNCLEWSAVIECAIGQICDEGNCVICIENWSCDEWSACVNGTHTRNCTDLNKCGTIVKRPALSEPCNVTCIENWSCGEWSACVNGSQSRTCIDLAGCAASRTDTQFCGAASGGGAGGSSEQPAPPFKEIFEKIPRPSRYIPHGNVPAPLVDIPVYTAAAAIVVSAFHLVWIWFLALLFPAFLLRLRHFCVAILDVNLQLPFFVDGKAGKTTDKEKLDKFIKLLSEKMGEKIIYVETTENWLRFVFEKSGFLELQIDVPAVLSAHFSSRRKANHFRTALEAAIQESMKSREAKELLEQIRISSESVSIIAAIRSMARLRRLRKVARAIKR